MRKTTINPRLASRRAQTNGLWGLTSPPTHRSSRVGSSGHGKTDENAMHGVFDGKDSAENATLRVSKEDKFAEVEERAQREIRMKLAAMSSIDKAKSALSAFEEELLRSRPPERWEDTGDIGDGWEADVEKEVRESSRWESNADQLGKILSEMLETFEQREVDFETNPPTFGMYDSDDGSHISFDDEEEDLARQKRWKKQAAAKSLAEAREQSEMSQLVDVEDLEEEEKDAWVMYDKSLAAMQSSMLELKRNSAKVTDVKSMFGQMRDLQEQGFQEALAKSETEIGKLQEALENTNRDLEGAQVQLMRQKNLIAQRTRALQQLKEKLSKEVLRRKETVMTARMEEKGLVEQEMTTIREELDSLKLTHGTQVEEIRKLRGMVAILRNRLGEDLQEGEQLDEYHRELIREEAKKLGPRPRSPAWKRPMEKLGEERVWLLRMSRVLDESDNWYRDVFFVMEKWFQQCVDVIDTDVSGISETAVVTEPRKGQVLADLMERMSERFKDRVEYILEASRKAMDRHFARHSKRLAYFGVVSTVHKDAVVSLKEKKGVSGPDTVKLEKEFKRLEEEEKNQLKEAFNDTGEKDFLPDEVDLESLPSLFPTPDDGIRLMQQMWGAEKMDAEAQVELLPSHTTEAFSIEEDYMEEDGHEQNDDGDAEEKEKEKQQQSDDDVDVDVDVDVDDDDDDDDDDEVSETRVREKMNVGVGKSGQVGLKDDENGKFVDEEDEVLASASMIEQGKEVGVSEKESEKRDGGEMGSAKVEEDEEEKESDGKEKEYMRKMEGKEEGSKDDERPRATEVTKSAESVSSQQKQRPSVVSREPSKKGIVRESSKLSREVRNIQAVVKEEHNSLIALIASLKKYFPQHEFDASLAKDPTDHDPSSSSVIPTLEQHATIIDDITETLRLEIGKVKKELEEFRRGGRETYARASLPSSPSESAPVMSETGRERNAKKINPISPEPSSSGFSDRQFQGSPGTPTSWEHPFAEEKVHKSSSSHVKSVSFADEKKVAKEESLYETTSTPSFASQEPISEQERMQIQKRKEITKKRERAVRMSREELSQLPFLERIQVYQDRVLENIERRRKEIEKRKTEEFMAWSVQVRLRDEVSKAMEQLMQGRSDEEDSSPSSLLHAAAGDEGQVGEPGVFFRPFHARPPIGSGTGTSLRRSRFTGAREESHALVFEDHDLKKLGRAVPPLWKDVPGESPVIEDHTASFLHRKHLDAFLTPRRQPRGHSDHQEFSALSPVLRPSHSRGMSQKQTTTPRLRRISAVSTSSTSSAPLPSSSIPRSTHIRDPSGLLQIRSRAAAVHTPDTPHTHTHGRARQ